MRQKYTSVLVVINMNVKKLLHIAAYTVLALFGIGLTIYPALSNWLYESRQDGVIESYQAAVKEASTDTTKEAALEAARQYNEQLLSKSVVLSDPFHAVSGSDAGSTAERMDIAGTGVIAYVEIPVIDVYLPIYYGTTEQELETGVGMLECSSLPVGGDGTHTILCGHSGLSSARIFTDLPSVVAGDVFFIHVLDETLAYQVDQIVTVLPEDLSQINIDPDMDYCTLLTCTPYGINTHRLLVRGTRIDYQEAVELAESKPDRPETSSTWASEYSHALLCGIAVLFLLLGLWKVVSGLILFIRTRRAHGRSRLEKEQKGAQK